METLAEKLIEALNGQSSFASIFTKDDVIALIENTLTDMPEPETVAELPEGSVVLSEDDLWELAKSVTGSVQFFDASDVVDFSSAQFEFDYDNRVVIEDIELKGDWMETDRINDALVEGLDEIRTRREAAAKAKEVEAAKEEEEAKVEAGPSITLQS